ncbi:MAG: hypothetical protein LBB76_00170 [Azoarcus sp.]|jgi:hypothetical protein|nr:hypothetical protein [Azoarcus sp.]
MNSNRVLSLLASAHKDIRRAEQEVMAEMNELGKRIATIEAGRLNAYRTLARMRLGEITANTVVDNLNAIERKARSKFDAFTQLRAQLQEESFALEKKIAEAEEQREAILRQIDGTRAEIAAVEEKARQSLAGDADWARLVAEVRVTEQKFAAANAKAEEREKDRENKSQPYLADPLFKYLHERHYGTAEYRPGMGWIRWGDGWVAKVIQFEAARRNFAMLNALPVRLREHVENLHQILLAQTKMLESKYRQTKLDQGVGPLEEKLAGQNKALENQEKTGKDLQEARARNLARHQNLVNGDDANGLNAALAIVVTSLRQEGLPALMEKALKTATPKDDEIVLELETLQKNLSQAQADFAASQNRLSAIKRQKDQYQGIEEEFRARGYDGDFRNEEDIRLIIDDMKTAARAFGEFWKVLDRNYLPRPKPSSNHWSTSGGISGGGFASRGSIGGGGFKTGGGF